MLISKISKRAYSKMISHLNSKILSSTVSENGSTFLHGFQPQIALRIQCVHSSRTAQYASKVAVSESTSHSPISISVSRFSRAARTDAQTALFDYLHCTRGLNYLDAEHISKNSPQFLQDLLSKVELEQDVLRSLSRFFRYHPINEFEPFLESLGLNQSEIASLLPRDLMFLSDDQILLDNYQILCDYGIPRSKIGKIYVEAHQVFRYEFGLERKLTAYEQLGLSKTAVIKLVSCSPRLLVGDMNNEFVEVLQKLKQVGFENDWIGGYLSSKSTYNWNRMLETLRFLSEVGYNDAQMGVLFKASPALLFEGSGKQVYVLFGRLLKLGLKMDKVYALFQKNPEILSPKFAKNFWKAVQFLFDIRMEPENIAKMLSSHTKLLGSHSLKRPKTILRDFDGDSFRLCQVIKEDPLKLFSLASKSNGFEHVASKNPSKLLEKTEFLLRIGYVENSDEMAKALKQFRGRGDQLQERFDCLVEAGFGRNVASNMVKQAPTILNQTKDVLEKKIDCLKNFLGYPLESIVAFPTYLCYDMERINRRFSMYAWLRDKGAAKSMLSLSTLLACSDARYVRYFVNVHPEGPAKWENLKKSLVSS